MNNLAIRIENLSKRYRINAPQPEGKKRRSGLGAFFGDSINYVLDSIRKPAENEILWALKDINLEIESGEVLGIIGKNGAGKSTLLKILSRITEPTEGRIEIFGRASSLLEVGTGFHPDLTGRENVYINGTMMGMSNKEIDRKFEEIVEFAEVGKFIDTPVKYYSSGMYVRLGFSVAAHLEPDILIVDEVLAVGDIGFQKKCLGKMGDSSRSGRTVLYVSHNMASMKRLCERVIYLVDGRIVEDGNPDYVIDQYIKDTVNKEVQKRKVQASFDIDNTISMQILAARLFEEGRKTFSANDWIDTSREIGVEIEYEIRGNHENAYVLCQIRSESGEVVLFSYDGDSDSYNNRKAGKYRSRFVIPKYQFVKGIYTFSFAIVNTKTLHATHNTGEVLTIVIEDTFSLLSQLNIGWPGLIRTNPEWETAKG